MKIPGLPFGLRDMVSGRSLLGDLFVRVSVLLAVMILFVGLLAFVTARSEIDDVYDDQLIVGANVLNALMKDELRDVEPGVRSGRTLEIQDDPLLSEEDRDAFNSYADWRMFRIWRGPALIVGSDTGPALEPPKPGERGFRNVAEPAGSWRIYTLPLPKSKMVVQVGERPGVRDDLVQKIALDLALPLLLLIPLGGALIWISLTDGLRQLRAIIAQLGTRGSDLSPLTLPSTRVDLAALIGPINQLLGRLDAAMAHERSFVDHAAHQLRTPLAALRLQAQMLAREDDPAARREHAERLLEGVNRAAALVDQLLTLARLDSQTDISRTGTLQSEVTDAIAAVAPLASAHDVDLTLDAHASSAHGDPTLLRLIASNLIENAVKHSKPNTEVTISILDRPEGGHTFLVADQGPGLRPEERNHAFDRFYRVAGDRTPGAGLGLSIVWEAVKRLNGSIRLEPRADGESGLVVRVELPARAA